MPNDVSFQRPKSASAFTGTTRARVVAYQFVDSKYGRQVQFNWLTERRNRFISWLDITSVRKVQMHLDAGILIGGDEDEEGNEILTVVALENQPLCIVTLESGKIKTITNPDAKHVDTI